MLTWNVLVQWPTFNLLGDCIISSMGRTKFQLLYVMVGNGWGSYHTNTTKSPASDPNFSTWIGIGSFGWISAVRTMNHLRTLNELLPIDSPFQNLGLPAIPLVNGAVFWGVGTKISSLHPVVGFWIFVHVERGLNLGLSWEHCRWIFLNQNCDKLSLKHLEIVTQSKQHLFRKDEGLCPRCILATQTKQQNQQTSFNVYQQFSTPISVIQPMTKSRFFVFKEWSWQRKFFTWLGELLAGSGPKWVTNFLTEGVVNERNRLLKTRFLRGYLWCYQKEGSYSLRVLGGLCCLRVGVSSQLRSLKHIMTGQNQQKNLSNMTCFLQKIPKSEIHGIRIHMQNPSLLINRMLMWWSIWSMYVSILFIYNMTLIPWKGKVALITPFRT